MKRASQERVRQIYTSTPFQYAIGLLITAVHAREARVTFVGPRSRRAYAIARTAPGALAEKSVQGPRPLSLPGPLPWPRAESRRCRARAPEP